MASPPLPPSFFTFWSRLFTVLVALPVWRDADSIPTDRPGRGDDLDAAFGKADADESGDLVLILDSGAIHHATGDKRLLSQFAAAPPEDRAVAHRTRDGRELPAAGAGTVASEKFQLSGVLYVPGLASGTVLVSVQQLSGLGYLVMFGGGRCLVMDRSGGKLVGEGRLQEDDGLYRLEFLKVPIDAAAHA